MNWKLVNETRNWCLRACFIGAIFTIGIVFLQSISGAFNDILIFLWLWVAILILPVFSALWASLMINRHSGNLLPPLIHWTLILGTTAYMGMLFMTILMEGQATTNNKISILEYLNQSYFWLLPFEMILLIGYYFAFFRISAIFQPNQQIIEDFKQTKIVTHLQDSDSFIAACYQLVSSNDTIGLIQKLKKEFEQIKPDEIKDVVLLEGQYIHLTEQIKKGLLAPQIAQFDLNRITTSLISMVEQIDTLHKKK